MHRVWARQQRPTLIAAEGDEVEIPSLLMALQSAGHRLRIVDGAKAVSDEHRLGR